MEAQVIKDIRQYQQSSYLFEVVPSIRTFLFPSKDKLLDEEAAYTRSYTVCAPLLSLLLFKYDILQFYDVLSIPLFQFYLSIIQLEPGRVALSMRMAAQITSGGASSEPHTLSPSPSSSLKWERGKVSKLLQSEEDYSLM